MSKIHTPKFPMRNWILGRLYDFEDSDDMKALSDMIDDCRSREAAFDLTMIAHQLHGIAMGWRDAALAAKAPRGWDRVEADPSEPGQDDLG
jgi:hypothetical protein